MISTWLRSELAANQSLGLDSEVDRAELGARLIAALPTVDLRDATLRAIAGVLAGRNIRDAGNDVATTIADVVDRAISTVLGLQGAP